MDRQGHQPRASWLRWLRCCEVRNNEIQGATPVQNPVQPRDHCLLVVLGCQMQILFANSGVLGRQSQNSDLEVCDKAISRGSATGLEIQTQENTDFANGGCVVILRVVRSCSLFRTGLVSLRATCLPSFTWLTHARHWNRFNQEHRLMLQGLLLTAILLDVHCIHLCEVLGDGFVFGLMKQFTFACGNLTHSQPSRVLCL